MSAFACEGGVEVVFITSRCLAPEPDNVGRLVPYELTPLAIAGSCQWVAALGSFLGPLLKEVVFGFYRGLGDRAFVVFAKSVFFSLIG